MDLDVHQGDGTAEIFDGDERVFTLSLHGKNNFPFRKKSSDLDIGFEDGTTDEEYLSVLSQVLEEMSGGNFDLIFFQAGVDGLASDALGLLNLSREGMRERNKRVFEWRKRLDLPLLIFMGGGYANPIDDTVDAFCDLFLAAAGECEPFSRTLLVHFSLAENNFRWVSKRFLKAGFRAKLLNCFGSFFMS